MIEREQARLAARRLAIIRHAQEVTGNVARTCRYHGIMRQSYYTWLRRYEEGGPEALRDRSRRPHVSPNATQAEIVDKIVSTSASTITSGPTRSRCTSTALLRRLDLSVGDLAILKGLDMSRLPSSQRYRRHVDRWQRYEKADARSPGPDRREVHRSPRRLAHQAIPVHRDR